MELWYNDKIHSNKNVMSSIDNNIRNIISVISDAGKMSQSNAIKDMYIWKGYNMIC